MKKARGELHTEFDACKRECHGSVLYPTFRIKEFGGRSAKGERGRDLVQVDSHGHVQPIDVI